MNLYTPIVKSVGIIFLTFAFLGGVALAATNEQASAIKPSPSLPALGASIVLLGTAGGPGLRESRSQPASLLVVDGVTYQIDAGEGASRQLALVGKNVTDLKAVFITHHHLDHTAGLGSVIGLRWAANMVGTLTPKLEIYGPPGTQALGEAAANYFSISEAIFRTEAPTAPAFRDTFTAHDAAPGVIFEDDHVRVTAVENSHYSTVTMPMTSHGVDRSYSLRFDTKYGSVVFTGDTGPSEAVAALAKDCDVLVSEVVDVKQTVSFMRNNANISEAAASMMASHMEHEHLPPEDVGKLATQAHAKMIVLYHFAVLSEAGDEIATLVREVQNYYKGPVIAGHDLEIFSLK